MQNGTTTTLSYNLAGEQTSESYSGGTLSGLSVTNGFDPLMRRTNIVARSSTNLLQHAFAYDAASRLQRVTDYTTANPYTVGYTYVANSRLVGQIGFTNNGSWRMTTTKVYDFLNRLTSISSAGSGSSSLPSFSYVYNSANQRTTRTEADGSNWRFNYDPLGQVTSGRKYWPDLTPVAGQQFEYAFDDIGNRLWTRAGGDENGLNLRYAAYGANSLNEYTNRDVPAAVDVTGIELATNTVKVNNAVAYRKGEYFRKEISVNNGSAPIWQPITVTATNETTVSGNVFLPKTQEAFVYDLDGNLTSDGRWNYVWDAESRLVSMAAKTAVGPQISLRFEYDTRGRRVRKQVWPNTTWNGSSTNDLRFLYDSWNLIATLDSQLSAINSFLWGLDLSGSFQGAGGIGGLTAINDTANGIHFAAFDGNGNVATLIKANDGTVTARYEYGLFGEVIRATGPASGTNPFRFSTKFAESETEWVYYPPGRYYLPWAGRWASRDAVGELGGLNQFLFVGNDPVNACDPLGFETFRFQFDIHDAPWRQNSWVPLKGELLVSLDEAARNELASIAFRVDRADSPANKQHWVTYKGWGQKEYTAAGWRWPNLAALLNARGDMRYGGPDPGQDKFGVDNDFAAVTIRRDAASGAPLVSADWVNENRATALDAISHSARIKEKFVLRTGSSLAADPVGIWLIYADILAEGRAEAYPAAWPVEFSGTVFAYIRIEWECDLTGQLRPIFSLPKGPPPASPMMMQWWDWKLEGAVPRYVDLGND